jgi:hypothetical protein
MVIQEGYPQYVLEVVRAVSPVVTFFSSGPDDAIALFPDTEGMGLDTAQILYVPDGECVHTWQDKNRNL